MKLFATTAPAAGYGGTPAGFFCGAARILRAAAASLLLFWALTAFGAAALAPSDEIVSFVAEHEGFSAVEYQSGGRWYIGYGTACSRGEYPDGVTVEQARELLGGDLAEAAASVNAFAEARGLSFTQNEFDALASFTYSLGAGWISTNCRLRTYLLDRESYDELYAVNAMAVWCHVSGEVSPGVLERRIREYMIFSLGDYGADYASRYCYALFDAAGGTRENTMRVYLRGEQYGGFTAAARVGYELGGWTDQNGAAVLASDVAQGDVRLTAVWLSAGESLAEYSDVPSGAWFYEYITALSAAGVVGGYPDGAFRPDAPVSAGEALKLVLLAAGYAEQDATAAHWAGGYEDLAVKRGLLTTSDYLSLDEAISRRAIANLSAKALALPLTSAASPFADISLRTITALYNAQIIYGSTENGEVVYRPDDQMSRAEISAVVHRILNYQNGAAAKDVICYNSRYYEIKDNVAKNSYSLAGYSLQNGIMTYETDSHYSEFGIDVSVYQGDVDWQKVKEAGVKFAFIRVGYRGYSNGGLYEDSKLAQNLKGASEAGIEIGLYIFSQAVTEEEAAEEANFVLERISDYDVALPIVFDWESVSSSTARTYNLSSAALGRAADAFCAVISDAGYSPMIYTNVNDAYTCYDLGDISEYDLWLASYNRFPGFYYNFKYLQYTSSGEIDGIEGACDLNIRILEK